MTAPIHVAVTGGSGQLGTLVLRRLIDDRSIKRVVSIDLRPPLLAGGKLEAITADVRDPDFARHLAGCDALVHLAFVVTKFEARPVMDAINIEGSKNVFRAAAAAGIARIVYSSSVAQYGVAPGQPVPIVEDTPRKYVEGFAYSANKYRVEEFLDGFEAEHPAIAIVRLRPAILVGQRMEHGLGRALKRRILPNSGESPLPLVWDEDVADAIIRGLKTEVRGAFNLGTDEPKTAAELAQAAGLKLFSVPLPIALAAARLSPILAKIGIGEAMDPAWIENSATMIMSSEKARRDLGWKPRFPTATSVLQHFVEVVPGKADRRILAFLGLIELSGRLAPAVPELAGFRGRIHLCLTGAGGGDFGIIVEGGRVRIERRAPRPPTATVTMKAKLFLDLLAGNGDIGLAQMTGKVRIEGQGHASMIIGGMIATFRAKLGGTGMEARLLGRMARWFGARGANG